MNYEAYENVQNGKLIDRWPCDAGLDGSIKSNGSQEFLYEYSGNEYCVWMNWENEPVNPHEVLSPVEK